MNAAILMATTCANGGSMKEDDLYDTASEFRVDLVVMDSIERGLVEIVGVKNGGFLYGLSKKGLEVAPTVKDLFQNWSLG